jgi:hypothetical protein
VNPCAYGPRDPNTGRCPPKPKARKKTKAEQAALRKATAAAEKVVTAGLVGAGKGINAGLKAAGISAGAAAGTVALVAAAAAIGWLLGRALDKSLSGRTVEEVRVGLALDRKHAREALSERLGRPATLAEQQPITDWYNKALAASRTGSLPGLSPDRVAYDLWKSKLNAGVK